MSRVVIAIDLWPVICTLQNGFKMQCNEVDCDVPIRPMLDYLIHCALWSGNTGAYNHAQRWLAHYLPYNTAVELCEQFLIALDDYIMQQLDGELDLKRFRLSFELRGLGDLFIYRDEITVVIDPVEQQRKQLQEAMMNGDHIPERERRAYGL
jgi:hypothetical protein